MAPTIDANGALHDDAGKFSGTTNSSPSGALVAAVELEAEREERYVAASGDLCDVGRDGVTHYRCDKYADGTLTSPSGKVIREAPAGARKGFAREAVPASDADTPFPSDPHEGRDPDLRAAVERDVAEGVAHWAKDQNTGQTPKDVARDARIQRARDASPCRCGHASISHGQGADDHTSTPWRDGSRIGRGVCGIELAIDGDEIRAGTVTQLCGCREFTPVP